MISVEYFYQKLIDNGTEFFSGVPDSLLKDLCEYISDNTAINKHLIAANEGNALALAIGHHLATGKVPLVYMQNSGYGNIVNPLLSLADKEVYSIPMIIVIGWRGQPGVKDEPQHVKQGRVSEDLLKAMEIPYSIVKAGMDDSDANKLLKNAYRSCEHNQSPYALLVEKNALSAYKMKNDAYQYDNTFSREEALQVIVDNLDSKDIVVSSTGVLSRELYEYRDVCNAGHGMDFLTVGGMGHANQIALGIALGLPDRRIICLDGDGAILMHLGALALNGKLALQNFKHIVFNNRVHDSVGGQFIANPDLNIDALAKVLGYKTTNSVSELNDIERSIKVFLESEDCGLLEVKVNKGVRKNLGRPSTTPIENKRYFEEFIRE